uniref:Cytochrome P450 n=1 Tax=Plectus sambesii TaxID=2011161 RepID=A0A914UYU8_9BILA
MSALDVVKENMLLTIASGASIVIAIYVYRFYKKVREYPPGPFPLPVIGNLHQLDASNTHKGIERFSLQYGPVFTVFFPHPTIVVVGLPELREALIKQGDNFSGRFTAPMSEIFMSMANGGVIFASGENWRDQRRFSVHALRDFGMYAN